MRLYVVAWGTNLRYIPARDEAAAREAWGAREGNVLRESRPMPGEILVRPARADEVADWNDAHIRTVDPA